jgi:hypothetical protein
MRKIGIILFGLILVQTLYGQNYHKMIEANKYFDVALYEQGHICAYSDNVPPKRFFFKGDTIINSKSYSKIYAYTMSPTWGPPPPYCPPFEIDTLYSLQYFFIREDTLLQKVYRCCNGINNEEELLFDFCLQQGDTLGSYLTIDTIVNIVTADNKTRKKFYITDYPYDGAYYIEGLGGNRGPFIFPEPNFEGQYFTMCVKSNDFTIYGVECYDFISSTDDIRNETNVKIYPNPTDDLIKLNFSKDNNKRIEIYNCFGQQLKIIETRQLKVNMDISDYESGIYFISIKQDNKVSAYKVIKK